MQDYRSGNEINKKLKQAVVAIGNFDGVHRGHQKLIALAKSRAEATGKPWGLLTFEPHPRTFFRPQDPVFRLTPQTLKTRLAKALGADFILQLDFNEDLATMAPDDFVLKYLVQQLGVSHVVTGYDFHFGKGRKGTPETLRSMGAQHGFGVTVVDQVTDDGDGKAPFASSSIRSALRRGHVRDALRELGYDWIVMGEVVHGDQRGRTIGFPTANIIVDPGVEPFRGIYAVEAVDAAAPAGTAKWMGAAYFGDRPTFNTNRTFLEVYLLDQDIDLYGKILLVSFVDMIRGDKAFRSVDELVTQMRIDCDNVRHVLSANAEDNPSLSFPLGELQSKGLI
jgi:riboflavin kinase / FMN adenylyltransferase